MVNKVVSTAVLTVCFIPLFFILIHHHFPLGPHPRWTVGGTAYWYITFFGFPVGGLLDKFLLFMLYLEGCLQDVASVGSFRFPDSHSVVAASLVVVNVLQGRCAIIGLVCSVTTVAASKKRALYGCCNPTIVVYV